MGALEPEDGTGLPSGPQFGSYESFYDMCHRDCAQITCLFPTAGGPVRPGNAFVGTHDEAHPAVAPVGADAYGRLDVFWTPWAAVQDDT